MSPADAGVLILFGIVLPTTDIYSDITFALKLFGNGHQKYACSMQAPVTVSFHSKARVVIGITK